MNNEKIIEFYKKLEQDSNVKSNLKKKIQHVKNEDDLRKIIDDVIIPLSRKMGMSFTSDELMDYERHVSQVLNEIELENISGGASNKNLFLGGLTSLMFLGFGHLITGSTAQAVSLDQVIRTTRNQVDSIEYNPDKTSDTNPTNKSILSTPKTELSPSTEVTTSAEKQQVLDTQQTTDPNQDAEVNPAKSPRLNQLPTDSTDITDSTKVQPELNQSQSTATEETATTAQPANTIEVVDETHTVTTNAQEEQAGLNKDQILSTTQALTDATQTTSDTIATPNSTLSDGTVTVSSQNSINQLSNNKKLYCLEALNLCNPFIEKETKVIENVRFYNGFTNSIVVNKDSYTRDYLQDEGIGASNLLKLLYPSAAGELNIATASDSITTLDKCKPSPADIANIILCLFKYRNNDPETVARFTLLNKWKDFGEGFVKGKCKLTDSNPPTYDYDSFLKRTLSGEPTFAKQYKGVLIDIKEKLSKITDRDSRKKQLCYDLLNYEGETTVDNKKITTFFSIIQNAIYMIDNQEKNDSPKEDKNIRIFPKYAAERFILSYFIDKFDKDEQITAFYSKVTELLNNLSLSNERIVTEEELNSARKRIEETLPILNKCKANQFSPYKRTTVQNGTCYSIQHRENDRISFSKETFADCADIAVRHVMNLLIYSQGMNKNPTDPWANVLPEKDSDQEKDIQHKLDEVTKAIKNKGTQVSLYPLKARLQMFFLHQKEVGADKADDLTRTLWEYVIYNLTKENNEFAPLKYNRTSYELDSGYRNMLTFMCRCAQELFPKKDVKMAYEKVKECPEYGYNQNLNSAIKAVFKLFNECDCDISRLEGGVKITYHELGDMGFSIFQNSQHGQTEHNPSAMEQLTEQEINDLKESENDFVIAFINVLSNKKLDLKEDFYKLFSGEGFEYNYYRPERNLTLSFTVTDSDFFTRYLALKFLKHAQNEGNNQGRICDLLQTYNISDSKLRCDLNLKIGKNEVNISDFIFDRYINFPKVFNLFSEGKKAFEIIKSINVKIDSFGKDRVLTRKNTNTIFKYTLDRNGNAILYPMEEKENLYIPSTITVGKNKIKVAGLGNCACYNFKTLKKVIIENADESVTDFRIGNCTFYGCSNLELITYLHKKVKNLNIGNHAFYNCEKFKSLDLSSNDELENIFIGEHAFNASGIKSITISKNVKNLNIGNRAFYNCENFESLDLSSNDELENIFIGEKAFCQTAIRSIIIPRNVKNLNIGNCAFQECKQLESLDLSLNKKLENLYINVFAFADSTITSVTMPTRLKNLTIKKGAFSNSNLNCLDLSSLDELENISIAIWAFCQSAIKSIILPKNIKNLTIDEGAFQRCKQFEYLDLSSCEKLENLNIGNWAFWGSAIKSVILPKSLKHLEIKSNAFASCNTLISFDLSLLDNLETVHIGFSAFQDTAISSITIPKNLEKLNIDSHAFYNCKTLKSFDFSLNEKLETLHIEDSVVMNSILNAFVIPRSVKDLKIANCGLQFPDLSMHENIETLYIGKMDQLATLTHPILLPKNVKNLIIGEYAFSGCESIENLDLSSYEKLESIFIDKNAFRGSTIKSLILPKNVDSLTIQECAFRCCEHFETLDLSLANQLRSIYIADDSFSDNKTLEPVTIPKSVTELKLFEFSFGFGCKVLVPERFKEQLSDLSRPVYKIEYYKSESDS